MKLIVGLGNPGFRYSHTRHNIGSLVVKGLAKAHKIAFHRERKAPSLCGRFSMEGQDVLLALPLTFMNVSGEAVAALAKNYNVELSDLLLIYDDLDLEFGRIKVRPYGSSGGHRGIASVIEALHSQDFARVRIGIGRPRAREAEMAEYVLSPFTRQEAKLLKEVIAKASDCSRLWVTDGITASMNRSNQRNLTKGNGR